jgi:hypothetical protein
VASYKRARYTELRLEHFTPREARELSTLSKNTPALKVVREERVARRARFEKIAAAKIAKGSWRRDIVEKKWLQNLSRMYSKKGWRVQEGPKGKQHPLAKGSANPWALYRDAEKRVGGPGTKGYVSPWEVRQISQGTTRLEKGLIFVQQVERQAKSPKGLSQAQVRSWIAEKEDAIKESKGKRKTQLILEKNRLERLL